jgi:anti-sigma28 factor (negative regulator of flagellin synthesis)
VTEDNISMPRLADIRDRVARGSYVVDPILVAEAMLRRLVGLYPNSGPDDPQKRCS